MNRIFGLVLISLSAAFSVAAAELHPCGYVEEDLHKTAAEHQVFSIPVVPGVPVCSDVSYVDLSDELPPVGNQGGIGSCTSWSVAYYHRTQLEYRERQCDRVYLVYNEFVNTMVQKPVIEQLLPLPPTDDTQVPEIWDYLYEPDAESLLNSVMTRYIETLVYQGVLENLACEHAARMIAMKNATDNASDLIAELDLVYNKARQASITQEISEIVGGAAAV